jgi:hypothetical protein
LFLPNGERLFPGTTHRKQNTFHIYATMLAFINYMDIVNGTYFGTDTAACTFFINDYAFIGQLYQFTESQAGCAGFLCAFY